MPDYINNEVEEWGQKVKVQWNYLIMSTHQLQKCYNYLLPQYSPVITKEMVSIKRGDEKYCEIESPLEKEIKEERPKRKGSASEKPSSENPKRETRQTIKEEKAEPSLYFFSTKNGPKKQKCKKFFFVFFVKYLIFMHNNFIYTKYI